MTDSKNQVQPFPRELSVEGTRKLKCCICGEDFTPKRSDSKACYNGKCLKEYKSINTLSVARKRIGWVGSFFDCVQCGVHFKRTKTNKKCPSCEAQFSEAARAKKKLMETAKLERDKNKAIAVKRVCACGQNFKRRNGTQFRCLDCIEKLKIRVCIGCGGGIALTGERSGKRFCSVDCKKSNNARSVRIKTDPKYREHIRNRQRKYEKTMRATGRFKAWTKKKMAKPENKLQRRLRNRLWEIVRKRKAAKFDSAVNLVGCSMKQLRAHLEGQFKPGMDWSNYGAAWVIDHVVPIAKFNLFNRDEALKCFHFSNLQPLCRILNAIKGDKTMEEAALLPEFLIRQEQMNRLALK